jgi:Flp pilus assembly protein TadD
MLRAFEIIVVGLTLITVGGCASSKSMARNSSDPGDKSAVAGIGSARATPDARAQRRPSPALIAAELEQGYRAERAGKPAEARLAYERVLKAAPDHARAHHRLAIIADNARQFSEAEQHYLAVLRREPQNSDVLSDLGYSYQLQKRDDDSERVLREALTYNPKHRKALYNLGVLQANRGQYNEALASFQAVGTEAEARKALEKYFPDGPPATAGSDVQLAGAAPRNPFSPGPPGQGDARARQLMEQMDQTDQIEREPQGALAMDFSKGTARATAWADDQPPVSADADDPKTAGLSATESDSGAAETAVATSLDTGAEDETDGGPLVASFDRPAGGPDTGAAGNVMSDPAVRPAGGTSAADPAARTPTGETAADWEQARVLAAQIGLGAGTSLPLSFTAPRQDAALARSARPVQEPWSTAPGIANVDSLPSEFPNARQPFVRSR